MYTPHGKQKGLKSVRPKRCSYSPGSRRHIPKGYRGRRRHKDDKDLHHWLKLFANSINGCVIELNPETLSRTKAARVRVYSGEKPHITNRRTFVERPGNWYAPDPGALITAGGRLLLGMLERCVEGWGGTLVGKIGIRKLNRQGIGRRIIEKISRRKLVKASTYRDYERRIDEYARRRQRSKHSL